MTPSTRRLTSLACLLSLGLSHAFGAEPARDSAQSVTNTSFIEPNGNRIIQMSIDLPATPHEVFSLFTTAEGLRSWVAPYAVADFHFGGYYEGSFDPKAKAGDPNNIRNEVIAYVPDRVLVVRNVHTPASFAVQGLDSEIYQRTRTLLEFTAIDAGHTRFTVTNGPYATDERSEKLYQHFRTQDVGALEKMRERFEKGPVDWSAATKK